MSSDPLRDKLLNSRQYLANTESARYASWENVPGRDNAHVLTKDGKPAILVIVAQVVADRLSVGPLGNYQTQEEKDYKSNYRIECKDAKINFSLRRPSSYPEWAQDYDTAIGKISTLQEKIAQGAAPRMWFLDKFQGHSTLRFSRNLWEKKDFFPEDSDSDETRDEDPDDDFAKRKEYAEQKANSTNNYVVPARFKDVFETVALEYNIDVPPVFLANGKLVPTPQLAVRMPNALVEVMFSLRHYAIMDTKKGTSSHSLKSTGKQDSNTFTATMEQIKILKSEMEPKHGVKKKMALLAEEEVKPTKRKERPEDDDNQGPTKRPNPKPVQPQEDTAHPDSATGANVLIDVAGPPAKKEKKKDRAKPVRRGRLEDPATPNPNAATAAKVPMDVDSPTAEQEKRKADVDKDQVGGPKCVGTKHTENTPDDVSDTDSVEPVETEKTHEDVHQSGPEKEKDTLNDGDESDGSNEDL